MYCISNGDMKSQLSLSMTLNVVSCRICMSHLFSESCVQERKWDDLLNWKNVKLQEDQLLNSLSPKTSKAMI